MLLQERLTAAAKDLLAVGDSNDGIAPAEASLTAAPAPPAAPAGGCVVAAHMAAAATGVPKHEPRAFCLAEVLVLVLVAFALGVGSGVCLFPRLLDLFVGDGLPYWDLPAFTTTGVALVIVVALGFVGMASHFVL